jgi:hypothetical protein
LDQLINTYSELRTYQDNLRGHVDQENEQGAHSSFDLTASTIFARPNDLRVEFQSKVILRPQDVHGIFWMHGSEMKFWTEPELTFRDPESLDAELTGLARCTACIWQVVPQFLLGKNGIPPVLVGFEAGRRLDDETLKDIACRHVTGTSGFWTVDFWVDIQSGLLRRMDLRQHFFQSSTVYEPVANKPIADKQLEFNRPGDQSAPSN